MVARTGAKGGGMSVRAGGGRARIWASIPRALWPGAVMLALVCAAAPAAGDTPRPPDRDALAGVAMFETARRAFAAADRADFATALAEARRGDAELVAKAVAWAWYRQDGNAAGFPAIAAFILDNPGWPDLDRLQARAEAQIDSDADPRALVAFFDRRAPVSAPGLVAHGRALTMLGRGGEVGPMARNAWREMPIPSDEAGAFLSAFGEFLEADDHIARLERLLWQGQLSAASEQAARVPADWRALAEARIALQRRAPGVDRKVDAVPAHLATNGGLQFDRARWRRRAGLEDEALDILRAKPADLGEPAEWWEEQGLFARRALRDGRAAQAYALAKHHGQTGGFPLADAEFLAGFVALRFLNDPGAAFAHFRTLYLNVSYPVSLARGAYWAGRAAEAAGEWDIAKQWYRAAAVHGATFYGQTALLKLPPTERPAPPREPRPSPDQQAAFDSLELVRLTRLLDAIGLEARAARFIRHLATLITNDVNWSMTARLALEIGRPDLAVSVAREAAKAGVVLGVTGYPSLRLAPGPDADPSLLLGLIRQESGFRVDARSRAGALGLMQLMPATARQVSRSLNLGYTQGALTADPAYNIRLGRSYLAELIEAFDGSLVMALAGYNAGPGRARAWAERHGDPRAGVEEAIDWIEMIPFYETRNYVQRVLENATVYRWRLQGAGGALPVFVHTPSLAQRP